MKASSNRGWRILAADQAWFAGEGQYPLPAYSEFMPSPRLAATPLGGLDLSAFPRADPYGWLVSEMEEAYELQPGLHHLATEILTHIMKLGGAQPAPLISGHEGRNLRENPYWPPELAERAGTLADERYLVLLPLVLSRTQDDKGRVRWTFFGSSEQGPERAFWQSFFSAPGRERPVREGHSFLCRVLEQVYGEKAENATHLRRLGFRILPSPIQPRFKYWRVEPLPSWVNDFLLREGESWEEVRHLLTFCPFAHLPAEVRTRYLAGKLTLWPFPGSLVFWGAPGYRQLQEQWQLALQTPLLRVVGRREAHGGIRVPQSGWLHVPRADEAVSQVEAELLLNTYARTSRWDELARHSDPLAANLRQGRVVDALFSTALSDMGLYDKPTARNAQVWSMDGRLLLNGPAATRREIERAAAEILEGGVFRYRFQYPPMRVGGFALYWHRPLVAYWSRQGDRCAQLEPAPLGYLTAYRAGAPDLARPVELWPRLQSRENYRAALNDFGRHDHFENQTALNLISLWDAQEWSGQAKLPRAFARQILRIAKSQSLEQWLASLPTRAARATQGRRVQRAVRATLSPKNSQLPEALTFAETATRAFEEAFWRELVSLSQGRYLNKNNADCVLDPVTRQHLTHRQRDLEALGNHLLTRHRQSIAAAGLRESALVGELPFRWRTDFKFPLYQGWERNQKGRTNERNLLVVIPGRNRGEAVVMADHYDTAYREDLYEPARGGSGARVAAPGADDNASATATLLLAAPIFLRLAKDGKLARDVWLLHLTGEEFPSDCLGARYFCQAIIEDKLRLRVPGRRVVDLSQVLIRGIVLMDMIAHNRDDDRDVFQISPGKSSGSFQLAYQAHVANCLWNAQAGVWNRRAERRGLDRGRRSGDGTSRPAIARHPHLDGQVRTVDDPASSLYNTDGQIFSDMGLAVVLLMENYSLNRTGYHDSLDTMANIDLDYGAALSSIAIEAVARAAAQE